MPILQSGQYLPTSDHYLPTRLGELHWGVLPNADASAIFAVADAESICIDTISHEGILADQGRDPVEFFATAGIPRHHVLTDTIELAASQMRHHPGEMGPHVVTGPIAVAGARPGDVLEVEVLRLEQRVPYGVISNRHGKGALPGEYPPPEHSGPVSLIATAEGGYGRLPLGDGRSITFGLRPFLGIMGVAADTTEPVHSVPPGRHGGNLDIRHFGEGAHLFLPVQVPGALFYVGDPHFAQGNGEVALSAFEAPLRAVLRLRLHSDARSRSLAARMSAPWGRQGDVDVVSGLDADLNEAMRACTRNALSYLQHECGIPPQVALAYLSAAGDLEISQVVDQVQGVHCVLRRDDLAALRLH